MINWRQNLNKTQINLKLSWIQNKINSFNRIFIMILCFNIVSPEDGETSMKDYWLQMMMFKTLSFSLSKCKIHYACWRTDVEFSAT